MATLEWTDELRRRVMPRRLEDVLDEKRPSLAADWKSLVADGEGPLRSAVATGALAPALESLRGRLDHGEPPSDLDPDEIAIWLRLLAARSPIVLPRFLAGSQGLARAIEGWLRTIDVAHVRVGNGWEIQPAPGPQRLPSVGHVLRKELLRADAETYAACRALAAPRFEVADLGTKSSVVIAFPNETEWSDALAREYLASPASAGAVAIAVHASTRDLELARAVSLRVGPSLGELECLLDGLGVAAVPLLFELADACVQQHELERVARALCAVRSEEVAALLASHIGKARVRRHAGEYFARFPELAGPALRPLAEGKSRAAAMAQELLAQIARTDEARASDAAEAPLDALVSVLVSPPWDGGARPTRKPVIVKSPPRLEGPVAWHGATTLAIRHPDYALMSAEETADWERKVDEVDPQTRRGPMPSLFHDHPARRLVPPEARLRVWNEGRWRAWSSPGTVGELFAEFGLAAMPGAVSFAARNLGRAGGPWQVQSLAEVEAPELAPEMAIAFRRRALRRFATSWLRRFPEAAVAGLLPVAVGAKSARRTASEDALRWLAKQGHEARIRERATELGARGLAAVEELLAWDPLGDCPKKPPKLSARYRPEALVRPTTTDGLPLPLSAVRRLGEMLAFSPPDDPYAGLELVAEACDPRSLAEHAWSLAQAWEASGARKADQWMMLSLVHLADDEVIRRTTPALRNGLVVDVLAHIGNDAAAMELATIAARGAKNDGGYGGMRAAAELALDRIAEARGLDRDRLDELLTPTLGLDARGALHLDYGPRAFSVVFDEHLEPVVWAEDGGQSRALPRARKDDDPEKIAAARHRWDELREDVGAIGMFRIEALERAMLSGHEWTVPELEEHWAHHPLMLHLARRVVFAARHDRGPARTFRVTEDGTYADAHDEAFTLAPDDLVFVPHPLCWPDSTLATWTELFADYELIQPFAQLHRRRPRILEGDRAGLTVARRGPYFDRTHLTRRLLRCGWERTPHAMPSLPLPGERRVMLALRWLGGNEREEEASLTLSREGAQVPWSEASEEELRRVLDVLGMF